MEDEEEEEEAKKNNKIMRETENETCEFGEIAQLVQSMYGPR